GGQVRITGNLDNTSATFTLSPASGPWSLANGSDITGGTVNLTGGARLTSNFASLSNLTLNGDLDASGLTFSGLTVNGTVQVLPALFGIPGLASSVSQTLSGNATVLLAGGRLTVADQTTLTLANTLVARGAGA